MSNQVRLGICCILVIIAACMAGIVIGHRGGEDNRLKAEAVLTKAKAEFEKVKNELPKELIGLIEVSLLLVFLLTCGTIALLAYFIHRILQQQSEQRIILRITKEEPDFRLSDHGHVRIVNGQGDYMPESFTIKPQLSGRRTYEEDSDYRK